MKHYTATDLREALTLLIKKRTEDDEGGWTEHWQSGPKLWGCLWPQREQEGYQVDRVGGPFASEEGTLKSPPSPRFSLVIRGEVEIPPLSGFLWHLPRKSKRLLVTSAPLLIQSHQFQRMTVREDENA